MAYYPAPIKHNGYISTVFNSQDYLITNTTAILLQLKSNSNPNSIVAKFTNPQSYDYLKGQVYTLASDSTVISTLSFTNIPTNPQMSYVFTFILTPITISNPYYILPNTNFVSINGISTVLSGLSNVSLPSSYTNLIQQITIINTSYDIITPNFNASISVVGLNLNYKPPSITTTSLNSIIQSYLQLWNGQHKLTKIINLWYKTSTINSSVVNIVGYYIYDINNYYTALFTYDQIKGLYTYIYGSTADGSTPSSTSNGMSTAYLSTLTLYYTA